MTELELIIDFHKKSDRQGPGSERETLLALDFIDFPKDQFFKVADIGCGTGGQTLSLTQHINGEITAVDIFPPFLEELDIRAQQLGLAEKIQTLEASMEELPFAEESFDLLWSEGAIYNIGFENGIKQWRHYLKQGGYLAVSDVIWITDSRPKEIEDFWTRAYPEIDVASRNIKLLENNGYTLVAYFYLSQDSWMKTYYAPMEAGFEDFLDRNHHSELARKVLEEYQTEIELYKRFKDYYSYGFFVARKN